MSAGGNKFSGKALTGELKKLATEMHTVDGSGNPLTREQALARLIWQGALGGEVTERDAEGNLRRVTMKPVAWMQQFLFERIEGKAAIATQDETHGMKAADKVRELTKDRLNQLAKVGAAKGGPPKFKPKGNTDGKAG